MKSAEIRSKFLQFFKDKGHQIIPSSSLVPNNDATLLFTNSGMVQFKDYFLGNETPSCKRAVTAQRCVRAGGKHNDLENVGYTARHHTFFEMLGNFSFGDYFKREAIQFSWEFLTKTLQLPPEKLWVTVHISDDDSADIWVNDIGFDPNRISRLDEDNFWKMGDTGPCGPCSEIFFDHGETVEGDPPGGPNDDGDRYIEIWNLVFMQFEQQADGSMITLPNPCVDTGMGLERMAAVLQHQHNNYDIDLFQNLLSAAAKVTNQSDLSNQSLRVIADHIRSGCFLIIDGVHPSNEGRGYVLRRIIRRALRHGHKLGVNHTFFHKLVAPLCKEMGEAYPELITHQQQIEKLLLNEEEQFSRTLDNGLTILNNAIDELSNDTIPGDIIFRLYDTFGFPTDLTNDIAREQGLQLDMEGYEQCMQQQRQQARDSNKFASSQLGIIDLEGQTEFTGYSQTRLQSTICALYDIQGQTLQQLTVNQEGYVVLNTTPFYAESGGQVGDTGTLTTTNGSCFEVSDCQSQQGHYMHKGIVTNGTFTPEATITAKVDDFIRSATAANHSATHLLHEALRRHLGEHVLQKGSLVESQKLRFDFSHPEPISHDILDAIALEVNQQIIANSPVSVEYMSKDEATQKGAMALFGEKYGDSVRVLSMGTNTNSNKPYSIELCGGTHVSSTGDIGFFSIVAESGIAAGIRRIEAITGTIAAQQAIVSQRKLQQIQSMLKSDNQNTLDKVNQLLSTIKQLQKQNSQLQAKLASGNSTDLTSDAIAIADIKILFKQLDAIDSKAIRQLMDQLKNKLGKSVIVLASVIGSKVSLLASVNQCKNISAADIIKQIAATIDGKGGGRADSAQGGGNSPEKLPAAFDNSLTALKAQLQT